MHGHAPRTQGQGDPAGADAELQRGAVAGQTARKSDDRVEHAGARTSPAGLVVAGATRRRSILCHRVTMPRPVRGSQRFPAGETRDASLRWPRLWACSSKHGDRKTPRPALWAAYYNQQRAAWGFLPNYACVLASVPRSHRPGTPSTPRSRDGMDRRRFEIATIAYARSAAQYVLHRRALEVSCATSAVTRRRCARIAARPDRCGAGARRTVRCTSSQPGSPSTRRRWAQADVDGLRAAGLSDADIADVVYAVAARSFFTRGTGRARCSNSTRRPPSRSSRRGTRRDDRRTAGRRGVTPAYRRIRT